MPDLDHQKLKKFIAGRAWDRADAVEAAWSKAYAARCRAAASPGKIRLLRLDAAERVMLKRQHRLWDLALAIEDAAVESVGIVVQAPGSHGRESHATRPGHRRARSTRAGPSSSDDPPDEASVEPNVAYSGTA